MREVCQLYNVTETERGKEIKHLKKYKRSPMKGQQKWEERESTKVVIDKCVWQEYSDRCPMYSKQQ